LSKQNEKPPRSDVLREGQEFEEQKVIFKIVEVQPFFSASGRASYMVSYRLIDGKETTPVAYLWISRYQDIRPEVKKVVAYYLEMVNKLRGVPLTSPVK